MSHGGIGTAQITIRYKFLIRLMPSSKQRNPMNNVGEH